MSRNISKTFEDLFYNYEMPVIPIVGKRPIIKGWQKYCSSMPSDIEYASFNKAKNIGICLGKASGLVALDIDTDDQKVLTACPKSPLVKRGKKGETRFFRYNGERPLKKHDIGIEILSEGNQTVIPPSVHPDTKKEYIWTRRDVWFDDIDSLPILDTSFLDRLQGRDVSIVTNHHAGRNDKLKGYCAAKLSDGKDPTTIIHELIEQDKEEHGSNALFEDASEFRGSTNVYLNALVFVSNIARSINVAQWSFSQNESLINFDIKEGEITYKVKKLPRLGGIAQKMFEYIYETSPVQRTHFTFASVISTISVLIGNKVHYNGIYPNIYTMILSPSGFGKDAPLRFPISLFSKSGCKDLIGEAQPASDSAIIKRLDTQRERLDVIDEAAILFSAINNKTLSYLSKMSDVYANLYTSAGHYYSGKFTVKDGQMGACESPYVSMLCAMTIQDFHNHIDANTIGKGLGGRFLYFADVEHKMPQDREYKELPSEIVEYAKKCRMKSAITNDQGAYNMQADEDAKKLMRKLNSEYNRKLVKLDIENDIMRPIYTRIYVQMVKIAIIHACSYNYKWDFRRMRLTLRSVEFARDFIDAYLINMSAFLETNLSENRQSLISQAILRYITSKGSSGVTEKSLASYTYRKGLKKRDVNDIVNLLLKSEEIFVKNNTIYSSKNIVFSDLEKKY